MSDYVPRDSVPLAELPPPSPDDVFYKEWKTYLREAPRLLTEGHEGKTLLIKGDAILGVYDNRRDAVMDGVLRFDREPFFVKELQAEERILRIRGINRPWPIRLVR